MDPQPPASKQHIRKTNRYQTDLTDEQRRVIEPHLPVANSTGRPRAWQRREIVNGIFYVMRSGCTWRLLPIDLPLWSTIYRWFAQFRDEGRFEKINHALVMLDRERIGRHDSPTGAHLDFDRRLMRQFRGSVVTSDAGLLAYRELYDILWLSAMASETLADTRTGKNGGHSLIGLLRYSVFDRLAGYYDVNDAEHLRHDPAMCWIVGGKAPQDSAASPSQYRAQYQCPRLWWVANLCGQY